jgi:glycosyltransferase involved in cell wall biosynthesis
MGDLKLLFITTSYPTKEQPVNGVFVREHAKAVQLCNDVAVLHCVVKNSNLKGLWRIEQDSDESINEGIPTWRVWRRRLPIRMISYFNFIWSIQRGFRHIVSTGFRPDIIHAHIYEAGVPAILIGKLYNIPVVITEHSSAFPRRLLSGNAILKAKFAFRQAKFVFPVSSALQKAIEGYGIRARFRILPNVVDTSVFYPSQKAKEVSNPKRILFAGLLVPIKGIPYLLKALAQLNRQRGDWQLDIVGDGPSRIEYEHLAQQLGISYKVIFNKTKSKKEVAEFMRQADLFVLPSLAETFSVGTAEALATGIPVLATRSGGPEEFVTEERGLLIPPGNTEALFKGLDYMLNNLERFNTEQISHYATEHFSPERVGKQLQRVYLECIAGRKG